MVSNLQKDIIVNAIRVLRARRVRPNLKKIAWLVQREHSLSEKNLLTLIETLVGSKDILRVHFKGAISYRVPPATISASYQENSFDSENIDTFATVASSAGVQASSDSDQEVGSTGAVATDTATSQGQCSRNLKARRGGGIALSSSRGGGGRGGSSYTSSLYNNNQQQQQFGGSAPRPRLHAGPQVRDGGVSTSAVSSISDTISRVIMTGGAGTSGTNTNSSNSSNHSSSANGSVTPMSGRSTPTMGGSEGDISEVQCIEFETPCAPPRSVPMRGTVRRGRPPLTSFALGESKKARAPSSRSKRAKRVYDPSEGNLTEMGSSSTLAAGVPSSTPPSAYRASTSKRRSNETFNQLQGDVCDICQGSAGSRDVPHEFILRCSTCAATGHPSCLGYSAELAERSRNQQWTCMDCKQCTICNMDHLIGTLIFCDECDRAYHLTCHQPPLTTQPRGTWVCCYCTRDSGFEQQGIYQSSGLGGFPLTPRDSPIPDDESRGSSGSWQHQPGSGLSLGYDPSIPNATHWTVDQVVLHFEEKGFEDEARVLREQAVDGSAVLLMSRTDVLNGLGLKLGPALKMFRQVRILQTRLPNPPLLC